MLRLSSVVVACCILALQNAEGVVVHGWKAAKIARSLQLDLTKQPDVAKCEQNCEKCTKCSLQAKEAGTKKGANCKVHCHKCKKCHKKGVSMNDCTCANGVPAVGKLCPAKGQEFCVACDSGVEPDDNGICDANLPALECVCPHGVPAIGDLCPSQGQEFCASCDQGFGQPVNGVCAKENGSAMPKECTCAHGVPASDNEPTGESCPSDGQEFCASCDAGFKKKKNGICVKKSGSGKECTCAHGVPAEDNAATGESCPSDGQEFCASCDAGFKKKKNGICVKKSGSGKECTCEHGVPAVGNLCPGDGKEFCASCDAGFTKNANGVCAKGNGSAMPKECTCKGGVPATGDACPADGQNFCVACDSGLKPNKNGKCK